MKFLKKIFIPNEHNEYHPHLLHTAGVASLFVIIVALFGVVTFQKYTFVGQTYSNYLASVLPSVLVDLANTNRGTTLALLTPNPLLEQAAQAKANDMASKGYFAHTSPDGRSPWYWFDQAGYKYAYAGENLAINFTDSTQVNNAWMNSPLHRANILNGNFTEIGIATAQGTYQGRPTTFVVQEFGKPMKTTPTTVAGATRTATSSQIVRATTTSPVAAPATSTNVTTFASTTVLGASATTPSAPQLQYATPLEYMITNPSNIFQTMYLVIASIVALCLVLMIAIKPSRKNTAHILYAIGLLVLIASLLFIYKTQIMSGIVVG